MEITLWHITVFFLTSLSIFLPSNNAYATQHTLVAPQESLIIRSSNNLTKASVQINGWACAGNLIEKSQQINKIVQAQGIDGVRRYRSFASDIIDVDKATKGLVDGAFFNVLNLSSILEPTGKKETVQVSAKGKNWKHCFTEAEASMNRQELVRWAKYLLSKLTPIVFIPEKIDFAITAPDIAVTRNVRVVNIDETETENIKLQFYDISDVDIESVNGVPYHGEQISLSPGSSVDVTLVFESSVMTTIDGYSQFIRAVDNSKERGTFGLGHAMIVGKVRPVSLNIDVFDATDVADGITQQGGLVTGTKSTTSIGKSIDETGVFQRAKNKRIGYVADGNARLLIRAQTNASDRNILFKMPGTGKYGTLARLNKKTNVQHLIIQPVSVDTKNNIYQATAVIQAPERTLPERWTSFKLSICLESLKNRGKCDEKTNVQKEIVITPAPVVLVHGLWAGPESWGTSSHPGLKQRLKNSGYEVMAVGYNSSKGPTEIMVYNSPMISNSIVGLCSRLMGKGIACTKADIVAHSMGGLVSRKFIKDNMYYKNSYDYFQGTVRRLITIDTPHKGSGFANMLLVGELDNKAEWLREDGVINNCVSKHESLYEKAKGVFVKKTTYSGRQYIKNTVIPFLFAIGKDVDSAIRDIAISSDFLASLNNTRQRVPVFAIIGDTGKDLLRFNMGRLKLKGDIALKYTGCTHDDLFSHERSDGIVGYSSQVGNIGSKIVLSGVPHLDEGTNSKVIKWVLKMLLEPLNKFSNEAKYVPESFQGDPDSEPVSQHYLSQKSIFDHILNFLIPTAFAEDKKIKLEIDNRMPEPSDIIAVKIITTGKVEALFLNDGAKGKSDFEVINVSSDTWKVRVPKDFSGVRIFSVTAVIDGKVIKSNTIKVGHRLDTSKLIRVKFSPTDSIYLMPGKTEQLSVLGWLPDGYVRELSSADTGIVYSERIVEGFSKKDGDSPVISVSPDGLITALKPGRAAVVAQTGKFKVERQVIVDTFFDSAQRIK